MRTSHTVKTGDTPTLRWSLGADITGATARLHVADRSGELVIDEAVTIDTPATGDVSYTLDGTEFTQAGVYRVEIQTTESGVILTYPKAGYNTITVENELG